MKTKLSILFIYIFVSYFFSIPVYSKFILVNKIQSIGNLDLLLEEADQVVYPVLYSGRPLITMNLRNIKLLDTKKNPTFKIEVFKIIDDSLSFVGTFNYVINTKSSSQTFSISLPDFVNKSETYQFHVYDCSNILHSKFSYTFLADQIFNPPPLKEGLEPDGLDPDITDVMIETILRNVSINLSSLHKIPSFEKNDKSYIINLPSSIRSSNNQNLAKTTSDLNYKFNSLSSRFNRITNQVNFLNNSLRLKLNSDFSNFTGDLLIKGKIKTNNTADKTINLNLDDSIREGGAIIGKVASNTIPVLRFTKPASSATWTLTLPKDLIKDSFSGNKFKIKLHWSSNNNLGQSTNWQLEYFSYNTGESLILPSKSFSKLVSAPKQELALLSTEFEIPTQDFKDILVIKLSRKDSNNINPNLVSFEINYPALSLERF